MADHTGNLRKLCFHFPKKSPDYLLEMLTKHNGDYETTAAAIRKDGNICIKFFRNLVDRFRKCTNNAKVRTDFQTDERNEVFEVNIGHDLANTLREKFENATSLRVPEGFEPVISMPASLGKKLYLLYAESVFHQEETQKLEAEVRFAREDEEFARRIQEAENAAELEETRKKQNGVITSQSRKPEQRDEDLGDTISFAPRVPKPIIKPVPKRSVFEPNRTSEERDDPDLIGFGIWNNQPSTKTTRQTTSAVDSTDACENARSILAKYKLRSQEVRDNLDSQQLFVPGTHLSTVKPTVTLPREIVYVSPQGFTQGAQHESGPDTKLKSKLQQFVNPISPFSLVEFESETQKLKAEVRFAREDEEFARRIKEFENAAELEETRKKQNGVITSQSRKPEHRDEDLGDTISFAPRVPKPIIKPVPKRSVFEPNRTSEERDDPDLIGFGIWNNQPSTKTTRQTTSAVDSTDACENARSILAKYKLRSQEVRDNLDSQQLFVPGTHLSTVKPTVTLPREIVYVSPQGFTQGAQHESGPVTKLKSKLQQFVNPISPLSLVEFESETIEKNNSNSEGLQSASHYRDKAQKHLKNKQKYEDMAKSLLQDDRGLSWHYFQLSKQEARQWEECNHLATLIILSENLEKSTCSNVIDLHHLYVKEALQCLDIFLDKEICLLQVEAKASKKLSIITGRGKHSLHGIARIKPEVTRRLAERGLEFEEKNPGLLKATVRKDSWMTTDLARSCTEVE